MGRGRKTSLKVHTPRHVTAAELPACPLELDDVGLAEWNRYGLILLAEGRLNAVTAPAFAQYCAAWSRYAKASADVNTRGFTIETRRGLSVTTKANPMVAVLNKSLNIILRLGAEFGATPSSRRKFGIVEAPALDELDALNAEFS